MSIDRKDYIVYGYKLPYELINENGKIDFWDDKYQPMIEGHEGEEFTIIFDRMSGEYVVFGLFIACSDEYDGWDFFKLDTKDLDGEKVKNKFHEVFGQLEGVTITEPELFIFTNFY